MSWFVFQVLWFGFAAAVMFIDRQLTREQIDSADIRDRSVTPYLLFMVLFGAFILPFYLWTTRRTAGALVAGILLIPVGAIVVGGLAAALR